MEPCILAGTSEKGVCSECGKPWQRILERISTGKSYATGKSEAKRNQGLVTGFSGYDDGSSSPVFQTVGWEPTCECNADTVPATVLDPFAGSGTTLAVAQRLGRKGIGTDISEEYLQLAEKRLSGISIPMIL